jgi:hypothetical protein
MSEGKTIVTGAGEGGTGTTEANTDATKVEAGAGGVDTTKVVDDKANADKANTEGKDGKQPADPKDKPAGAPEKYEDFKLPEGVVIPDEVKGEYLNLFKEANLTQEAAQKLIDFQIGVEKKAADALTKHWDATHATWKKAITEDKDFGGEKFKESLALAKAALASEFADPELAEALEVTGAGNNPAVFRLLARLGKAVSDDKLVPAGKGKGAEKDPAKILFPNFK